ncbi:hypothetical protein ACOSQ4_027088 [Xanthoceras sorbifolium]
MKGLTPFSPVHSRRSSRRRLPRRHFWLAADCRSPLGWLSFILTFQKLSSSATGAGGCKRFDLCCKTWFCQKSEELNQDKTVTTTTLCSVFNNSIQRERGKNKTQDPKKASSTQWSTDIRLI